MAIESLAKPVVDALLNALDRARDAKLRANAQTGFASRQKCFEAEIARRSTEINPCFPGAQ